MSSVECGSSCGWKKDSPIEPMLMWEWTRAFLLWGVWAVKGTVLSCPVHAIAGGWRVCGGGRAGNVTVGLVLLHSRRIAATSWHSHGELVSSFSLISCFPAELAHQLFPDQLLLCTGDSTQVFFKNRFGSWILDKFWLFTCFHTGSKQRNSDFLRQCFSLNWFELCSCNPFGVQSFKYLFEC